MLGHAFKKDYSGNVENKLKGVQGKGQDFRQLRIEAITVIQEKKNDAGLN